MSLIEKGTPEQYAYGAKGIGEISSIPIAPAIANAYRRIDGEPRRSCRFNIQVIKNRIFA